jgi:hypothetical protein
MYKSISVCMILFLTSSAYAVSIGDKVLVGRQYSNFNNIKGQGTATQVFTNGKVQVKLDGQTTESIEEGYDVASIATPPANFSIGDTIRAKVGKAKDRDYTYLAEGKLMNIFTHQDLPFIAAIELPSKEIVYSTDMTYFNRLIPLPAGLAIGDTVRGMVTSANDLQNKFKGVGILKKFYVDTTGKYMAEVELPSKLIGYAEVTPDFYFQTPGEKGFRAGAEVKHPKGGKGKIVSTWMNFDGIKRAEVKYDQGTYAKSFPLASRLKYPKEKSSPPATRLVSVRSVSINPPFTKSRMASTIPAMSVNTSESGSSLPLQTPTAARLMASTGSHFNAHESVPMTPTGAPGNSHSAQLSEYSQTSSSIASDSTDEDSEIGVSRSATSPPHSKKLTLADSASAPASAPALIASSPALPVVPAAEPVVPAVLQPVVSSTAAPAKEMKVHEIKFSMLGDFSHGPEVTVQNTARELKITIRGNFTLEKQLLNQLQELNISFGNESGAHVCERVGSVLASQAATQVTTQAEKPLASLVQASAASGNATSSSSAGSAKQ